ncbi:MAG TPA: hypothetical protein VHP37_18720 [Burkholderiales bacterium]|nr:hypothetical protein [Burkholderiales bacterium]
MARLPPASRESVPENQRGAYDEIVKAAGSVPRFGPGSLLLHLPHAHQRLMGFNRFLRGESSLPKKLQELAMETLGQRGAIELALFLGNYASLALVVNSFDADLPADRKEPLLPI